MLTIAYVAWEAFLERKLDAHSPAWWTPPPLMPVSIWARSKGQLAAVLMIAFVEMCAFNVFCFWVQVRGLAIRYLDVLTSLRSCTTRTMWA